MNDVVVAVITIPREMGEKDGKRVMGLVDSIHGTLK